MAAIIERWRARRHERRHLRKVFTCGEHCGCDCLGSLCRHDEFEQIGPWCGHCGEPLDVAIFTFGTGQNGRSEP